MSKVYCLSFDPIKVAAGGKAAMLAVMSIEEATMRARAVVLALAMVMAPLGVRGADLVVWWDEGYCAEKDEAVREIIAAFEQKTGKEVELVLHPMEEHADKIAAALEVGQPPDFAFGFFIYIDEWAFDDRLVDLTDTVGSFSNLFDPDVLSRQLLLNASTGQRALYGVPMGRTYPAPCLAGA
jgi:ABC-type glycerol-3-phosphate transport system substrate-binding protein